MQNDELQNPVQTESAGDDAIDTDAIDNDGVEEIDYDAPNPDEARMIELVGYLVQGLVAHPEEVEVEEFFDDMGTVYGVRVHPEDIGRIIGKEGRVANALRQVVKAAATKANAHVMVEILTDDDNDNLPLVDSNDADPSPAE